MGLRRNHDRGGSNSVVGYIYINARSIDMIDLYESTLVQELKRGTLPDPVGVVRLYAPRENRLSTVAIGSLSVPRSQIDIR